MNANFTELYIRIAALESGSSGQAAAITALQSVDAVQAANNTTQASQIAALQAADATTSTLDLSQSAQINQLQTDLANEVTARQQSALQVFTDTTNGMTLEAGKSYSLQNNHTVILPVLSAGQWVRIQPASGDWYNIGTAAIDHPATHPFDPAVWSGFEPNSALLFIFSATQIKVRQ